MREGITVTDHIRELKKLIDKRRAVEVSIEEDIQVCTLLVSLSNKITLLATAIEAQEDMPKFDSLISMLEDFERKQEGEK